MIHWTSLFPVYSQRLSFEASQIPQKIFRASSDGVLQRSEHTIFGASRQLRRMPRAHCGSFILEDLQYFLISWTRFCIEEATNRGDPTAASSISNPSLLFLLILLSIVFRASFDQTSHLSLLSSRPQELGAAFFINCSLASRLNPSRLQFFINYLACDSLKYSLEKYVWDPLYFT